MTKTMRGGWDEIREERGEDGGCARGFHPHVLSEQRRNRHGQVAHVDCCLVIASLAQQLDKARSHITSFPNPAEPRMRHCAEQRVQFRRRHSPGRGGEGLGLVQRCWQGRARVDCEALELKVIIVLFPSLNVLDGSGPHLLLHFPPVQDPLDRPIQVRHFFLAPRACYVRFYEREASAHVTDAVQREYPGHRKQERKHDQRRRRSLRLGRGFISGRCFLGRYSVCLGESRVAELSDARGEPVGQPEPPWLAFRGGREGGAERSSFRG
mmetsp:Transcript_33443/g.81040  ORF Transcript_33443/g.81040 Transcript_33443/m.81040 type:complete len:267 (-) Transcript_33443:91-891(-)